MTGEFDSLGLGQAAEWYAARGIPVFPCRPRGKEPLIQGGFHAATIDKELIRRWWERWPEANIAVPTGAASGWLVVDVDPRNGGDATMEDWIARFGRWPATAEALTGGGGRHIIFRHEGGLRCRPLGPGVDLKAEGGYIVVAPSVHPSGNRYQWDGLAGAEALLNLAAPPGWLLRLAPERKPAEAKDNHSDKIPKGARNATLTSMAGAMRRHGMTVAAIEAALLAENERRCEPPLPEAEVRRIAASVGRYPPAKSGDKKAPRIVTAAELLKMKIPKPRFWIEGVLTGPGAWTVVGSHKSGKTTLAAQMGIAYHAGVPLWGRFPVTEARPVLFIEQDDPAGLATLQDILSRSPIPVQSDRFITVENPAFTLGPDFINWLRQQIIEFDLGLVVLDSYTKMRPPRGAGIDIVKAEATEFSLLDTVAKQTQCVILILHHRSRGNAALDWSEQAAGTFAIGAATEGEIHISRFRDLAAAAQERLVQLRGRRLEGLEAVIRFRKDTLDYELVCEGAAAPVYPAIFDLQRAFGGRTFSPKQLYQELGMTRASATRLLSRLASAGVLTRCGYGEYRLAL